MNKLLLCTLGVQHALHAFASSANTLAQQLAHEEELEALHYDDFAAWHPSKRQLQTDQAAAVNVPCYTHDPCTLHISKTLPTTLMDRCSDRR
eukprot:SAG31_NODE_7558_length_1654_cov_5.819936_2_plen_92_part_00